MYITLTTL